MTQERWWLVPGEALWEGRAAGKEWRAWFLGDDGERWLLEVISSAQARGRAVNYRWDYGSQARVPTGPPVAWNPELAEPLDAALRQRFPNPPSKLGPVQRRVLEAVAARLEDDDYVSGRRVRANIGMQPGAAFQQVVAPLVPRYLEAWPNERGDDFYQLTFGGILQTSAGGRASKVLEDLLGVLRRRYREDPDFRKYSWDQLKELDVFKDLPLQVAKSVISMAGWFDGAGGSATSYEWGTPRDIERLQACEDFGEYMTYLRTGWSDRPWPSAPARLPQEGDDAAGVRGSPVPNMGDEQGNGATGDHPGGRRGAMPSVDDRDQLRRRILEWFYDETQGDPDAYAVPDGIAQALAADVDAVRLELRYLDQRGLLKILTQGMSTSMTLAGVDEVESWRRRPLSEMLNGTEIPVSRSPFKPTPWAFVSSVKRGLEAQRDAVRGACLRAHVLPVGMETWTAEDRTPAAACKEHLASADVVLLIVSHRYGTLVPGTDKSYTEIEYDEALAQQKPVLAFVATRASDLDPRDLDPRDIARLQQFRARLGTSLVGEFASEEELETKVYQSLVEWRQRKE